jgi:hypothetical protein
MKNHNLLFALVMSLLFISEACSDKPALSSSQTIRPLKDTIGFAQYSWQMDSLMSRVGVDRAYFGCDEKGNTKARLHEAGIIDIGYKYNEYY